MQITADVSKGLNITFILNVYLESSFHFVWLFIVLAKKMLFLSHKMVFIKNETTLLFVTMVERAKTFAATTYNFLI